MTEEQELLQITVARACLLRSQGRLQQLAQEGYQKRGRGAIVIDASQEQGFFYISKERVADRLEGERRDRALSGIDRYNPMTEAVVIGIEQLENGHFLINTLVIRL